MTPSERAALVNQWTQEVMFYVAKEALGDRPREEVPGWLAPRVAKILQATGGTPDDVASVMDEILGLGPLEPLLRDQTVREIHVRGPQGLRIVRGGAPEPAPVQFADEAHLKRVFGRVFKASKIDLSKGKGEAKMMDGSTLTAEIVGGTLHASIVRPG